MTAGIIDVGYASCLSQGSRLDAKDAYRARIVPNKFNALNGIAGWVKVEREFTIRALTAHLDRLPGHTLRVLTERGGLTRTEDFSPVCLPPVTPHGQFIGVSASGHNRRELLI